MQNPQLSVMKMISFYSFLHVGHCDLPSKAMATKITNLKNAQSITFSVEFDQFWA